MVSSADVRCLSWYLAATARSVTASGRGTGRGRGPAGPSGLPPEVRPAPLRAPMQASLACASCTPPSLPATRPRCPREAGRSPAAPGRPARCGPGPPRSPRRATGGWLFAPRACPACVDANSLRRVWGLNFEFRAVARRTSSCTRMLSRSSGPRAVPRPRPAIPRPRPAIPQLFLPRLGCGQHSPTVRRAPAAVRRAPAPGCPGGRLRRNFEPRRGGGGGPFFGRSPKP